METVEINIGGEDKGFGSGADLLFDLAAKNYNNPSLSEAIMISTYKQLGLSYTKSSIDN